MVATVPSTQNLEEASATVPTSHAAAAVVDLVDLATSNEMACRRASKRLKTEGGADVGTQIQIQLMAVAWPVFPTLVLYATRTR